MRLRVILTVFMTSLAVVITAQDQSPSFLASSRELVVLPVIVLDKRGGFVTDLGRERFAVYDNGQRREISLFTNEDTPVTVGLVIDNSGSMGPRMPEVIVGTTAFARSSNPDDELFTLAFNDSVVESRSRSRLTAADGATL